MNGDVIMCNKLRFWILIMVLITVTGSVFAADPVTPPENSIPIVGQRINANFYPTFEGIRIDQLCEFMWRHMPGTHGWEWASEDLFKDYYEYCASIGMYVVFTPSELGQYQYPTADNRGNWFRNPDYPFSSDFAYAKASVDYSEIVEYADAATMWTDNDIGITNMVSTLAGRLNTSEALWFYYLLDEGPARQRNNMLDDNDYEIYFPNIYTQDWDTSSRPYVPALDLVTREGIYSWLKYAAENQSGFQVPTTINFSMLNTIEQGEYTGIIPPVRDGGNFHRQAVCVDALCNAYFQRPPVGGVLPDSIENAPDFILFDYYPFRYVNSDSSSTATMCDDDWEFLIEHFEEGIDSTIVTALENDVITYYLPQAFGAVTGWNIRSTSGVHYKSLTWRKPAPQEFLLNCNLALLHQAKGIFPYSLRSYIENPFNLSQSTNFLSSALLDINLIPFDAPYEEYVYMDRCPPEDTLYNYISPALLPPWKDGFDPLYTLPSPPTNTTDPKYMEDYSEWMYQAYGDLYRNLERNLAQVVRIAPEMYDLFWCEGFEDEASISTTLWPIPDLFVAPRIKVFENPTSTKCYMFYVNTYCRAENTPFEIAFDSADLPSWADCSTRLLDHSRRFIMEGTEGPTGTFTFLDTLGPGEARLVELIDTANLMPADLRITDNNVWTILPAKGDTATIDMTCVPGEDVEILARFYNMGTGSKSNIAVSLYDVTDQTTIDNTTISFSGLPYTTGNCWDDEYVEVTFDWDNISTSDIGPHQLEVRAAPWTGEPDRDDNTARITFLVEPNDWATEVRGNPWDMTEATSSIPDWYTDDISALSGWVSTAYTDSVSGMFEGTVNGSSSQTNRMTLDLSSYRIDGDAYDQISLIGKTDLECDVYLLWDNTDSQTTEVKIGEFQTTEEPGWRRLEVFDLSGYSTWAGKTITSLSLSFRRSGNLQNPVRLGWVKLENGNL